MAEDGWKGIEKNGEGERGMERDGKEWKEMERDGRGKIREKEYQNH